MIRVQIIILIITVLHEYYKSIIFSYKYLSLLFLRGTSGVEGRNNKCNSI